MSGVFLQMFLIHWDQNLLTFSRGSMQYKLSQLPDDHLSIHSNFPSTAINPLFLLNLNMKMPSTITINKSSIKYLS